MTDDAPELSPEFENIPEPLRGRPQWLMWDARADRPKQPHWNGDHYGISWSDPDDWGSWSDARELVAGTDSWGIGYVNAVENDDYPSGRVFSLDIDGGVVDAEAAELAEWVPPLEPFLERDAYVEISPSGEGLKIPVLASSAPEWWSDMDNDDEHVGCEVLANKFTTLTGNLWPGAGTELPVYGDWLDEWLEAAAAGLAETREVYEKQTRPTPQSSLDETARGDAGGAGDYDGGGYDADVETVRDALACVSPDLGYNEWRNVGFAVCDAVDAGDGVENRTTARELYVAWSRGDYHPDLADDATASSWDSDARSRAEAVIDGWEPPSDGDVTAGTLWSLALDSDHGPAEWSPPSDWGDARNESVKEKVARYSDKFDDASEVPDDVVPSAGRTTSDTGSSGEIDAEGAAVAGSPPDGSVDGETADPRGEGEDSDANDPDSGKTTSPTSPGGGLADASKWKKNGSIVGVTGGYGYVKEKHQPEKDEPPLKWEEATNFRLETLAVIDADGEQQLRLRVQPTTPESSYEVEVHPTVFNESRTFKEEVVRGRTTTFDNVDGNALDDLRLTVGRQDAPRHTGVAHVGAAQPAHDDDELPADAWNEWVTPDGVLTADGWADDAEANHTYLARSQSQTGDASIVGEKWNLTPSDDKIDESAVAEICRRLPEARLPERGLATLAWFYTAPTRPLVYHAEEQFPHLSVRGKTGSGKTAWLSTLSQALGMEGSPHNADATAFSLEMLHVGSRGAPVWIDEYKPSQMKPSRRDKLHGCLRDATKEAVSTKGRPDQSFIAYRMQAPVCLSGEQTVKEPAVARRSMQVQLSARATDMQTTRRAYAELNGEAYEIDGETRVPEGYDLSHHALAYHRWLLDHDPETLVAEWRDCRKETAELLDSVGSSLGDTEREAVQTIVFGYRLFRSFATDYGVDTAELPGRETLESAVEHVCGNVGKNGQRREHGDEFLELVSQAAAAGYLAPDDLEHGDTPYRVYEPEAAAGDAVALHLPTVYPEVRKFVRDYGLEAEYNLLSKTDYTDEFGDVEGSNSHILGVSKKVRNVKNGKRKRCLVVDVERCRRRLGEDFVASAFGAEVEGGSEVDSDGDDGGGGSSPGPLEGGDQTDVSPAQADGERLAPGDVTTDTPNARGRVPAVEGRVTAAWEDRYGNPTVSLGDGSAALTAAVVGRDRPELREGARVVVAAAQATTDDLGNLSLEIDPPTDVTVVSTPSRDDSGGRATASTDGGTDTDSGGGEAEISAHGDDPVPEVVDRTDDEQPDETLYIGRGGGGHRHMLNTDPGTPGWLGNPHEIDDETWREKAIQQFAETFVDRLRENPVWGARVADAVKGETLGCYCSPADCHGEVYREWIDTGDVSRVDGEVPSPRVVRQRAAGETAADGDDPGVSAETDHETLCGRVTEWLRDDPDPVTVTRATVDLNIDAAAAREALDSLVDDGRLIDTSTEGVYEVNR